MTLNEFKFIWHMEYGHRMWGRFIGIAFFLPLAVFWKRGMLNRSLKIRCSLFGSLLVFQVWLLFAFKALKVFFLLV